LQAYIATPPPPEDRDEFVVRAFLRGEGFEREYAAWSADIAAPLEHALEWRPDGV
jgi:hypothetical protein